MRKVICLMAVLLMCLTLVMPAAAAGDTFVPSISYKDGPEITEAEQNGKAVTGCVVVTSLKEAKEKTTDIGQDDRDLLWDVYNKLSDGTMELELDSKKYVVRELVDISFKEQACVLVPHGHEEELKKENTTIEITLDMGIPKGIELKVFVYLEGKWVAVEEVTNNGDGTATCVFEDICPVAFAVEADAIKEVPKTGDEVGANISYWVILLVASFVAVVVLLINRRKFIR